MSYKDLLVVLDAEPTARECTDLAAALAERFSAHLAGLYPLPTPQMPRHFAREEGVDHRVKPGDDDH
jgi:hypothetical protein